MSLERCAERFARTRSEQDFRALHELVGPRLWLFALRLANWREQEAEELVQETWLRAIRGIDSRRGGSRFTTWLLGILVHVDRERLRRRDEALADHPSLLDTAAEPSTLAFDLELEQALARIPPAARSVLLLHDLEGRTHAEIARMLSIAPGTSKSQLHDARARMRELLATSGAHHER